MAYRYLKMVSGYLEMDSVYLEMDSRHLENGMDSGHFFDELRHLEIDSGTWR